MKTDTPLIYTKNIPVVNDEGIDIAGYRTNIVVMGRYVLHNLPLAKDGAGYLYYYENGVYKPDGEHAVTEMMHRIFAKHGESETYTNRHRDEVVKYLMGAVWKIDDRPDLYRINLLNGLFDWRDQTLYPHDPNYRTLVQIPINYDPDATCPTWDKFLNDLFPVGPSLLYEIIAWAMIPYTKLQKCIVLVGAGSNGKSTYLSALSKAIGDNNVSAVSLHKLTNTQDKFYNAMLVGKLINKFGDLSNKDLQDVANFKALTGEDAITVEYKHKNAFSYTPFCRMIFACNKMVKAESDESMGFYRRFFNVPFTRQFDVDPRIGLELEEELQTPRELSGLFNKLALMIPAIVERGAFNITPAIASAIDNYQPIPPSVKKWLEANLVADEDGYLPHNAFYSYFTEHCYDPNEFTRSRLIGYVKNLFPEVRANVNKRIWKNESGVKCFLGVKAIDPTVQSTILQIAFRLHLQNINQEEESIEES